MQFPNPASFTANEAITAGARVLILSTLKVALADASEREHGIALLYNGKSSYASGESVPVHLHGGGGIMCIAGGAFSAGATVQRRDDGKVDDTGTGAAFGIARDAAGADGDLVCVYPFGPAPLTTSVVLTSTNGTAGSAADLAALKAETEKIGDDVRAIHAALVTAGILAAS